MAQFTASTTLRNSTIAPSPVRLTTLTVVHGDGRIDQVASERPQPRQNPVLVGSRKPRIADDVGHQDRGQFSGLAHGANRFGLTRRSLSAAKANALTQYL